MTVLLAVAAMDPARSTAPRAAPGGLFVDNSTVDYSTANLRSARPGVTRQGKPYPPAAPGSPQHLNPSVSQQIQIHQLIQEFHLSSARSPWQPSETVATHLSVPPSADRSHLGLQPGVLLAASVDLLLEPDPNQDGPFLCHRRPTPISIVAGLMRQTLFVGGSPRGRCAWDYR
jgi:hypothetical protein